MDVQNKDLSPDYIKKMILTLKKGSWQEKVHAIRTLGSLDKLKQDDKIFVALCNSLEDKIASVREVSAKELGKLGNVKAIPLLKQKLQDEVPWVREAVAKALEQLNWNPSTRKDKLLLKRAKPIFDVTKVGVVLNTEKIKQTHHSKQKQTRYFVCRKSSCKGRLVFDDLELTYTCPICKRSIEAIDIWIRDFQFLRKKYHKKQLSEVDIKTLYSQEIDSWENFSKNAKNLLTSLYVKKNGKYFLKKDFGLQRVEDLRHTGIPCKHESCKGKLFFDKENNYFLCKACGFEQDALQVFIRVGQYKLKKQGKKVITDQDLKKIRQTSQQNHKKFWEMIEKTENLI